jgi:hypothetical protein
MHTRAVNAAAGVLLAAMEQGRQIPTSLAIALDSAGLLNSPEHAAEHERLLAERHSTNESVDEAARALRANRDRIAELEAAAAKARAAALKEAAEELMAACPEHGDADEVWMDCPCEFAEELLRKAELASTTTPEA